MDGKEGNVFSVDTNAEPPHPEKAKPAVKAGLRDFWEVPSGVEPLYEVLQTSA